jgi:hypothetical protein
MQRSGRSARAALLSIVHEVGGPGKPLSHVKVRMQFPMSAPGAFAVLKVVPRPDPGET